MLKLGKKVAVTGSLSCGKSSVCRFFKECGAYVISADDIVHQMLIPDTKVGQEVMALMGRSDLDRREIAKKVFYDFNTLKKLEALLHPHVKEAIEKAYKEAGNALFVVEIPLLFEAGWDKDFDTIIVVDSDPLSCQKRFQETFHASQEEYERRQSRLFPQGEKRKKATYVIENQGTLSDLKKETKRIYEQII